VQASKKATRCCGEHAVRSQCVRCSDLDGSGAGPTDYAGHVSADFMASKIPCVYVHVLMYSRAWIQGTLRIWAKGVRYHKGILNLNVLAPRPSLSGEEMAGFLVTSYKFIHK